MVAPSPSDGQTWIKGKVNHFDFQKYFQTTFQELVRYWTTKSYRGMDDLPYDPDAGLPDKWHEGHEPAVHLLTAGEAHMRMDSGSR